MGPELSAGLAGAMVRSSCIPSWQCADDPDAVCTRSVTVRLSTLHNSLVKLKHGGGVAMDGQDIQVPLLQGGLTSSLCPGWAGIPFTAPSQHHHYLLRATCLLPGNVMEDYLRRVESMLGMHSCKKWKVSHNGS